jgi:hypothetical protein
LPIQIPPNVVTGTGDDPTRSLGKVELLDRYTEDPGPGVGEGTTKRVQTNRPFVRIDAPFRLAPLWELNFRAEIPVVSTNALTPGHRHVNDLGVGKRLNADDVDLP